MPTSPRRLQLIQLVADTVPYDPVAHLARLRKAFEESGAISAYIAYRMELAHFAREDRPARHWTRGGLG